MPFLKGSVQRGRERRKLSPAPRTWSPSPARRWGSYLMFFFLRLKYSWFAMLLITAAAAAAKSLQSCPTLCDPVDGSPPGSPVPGILQARTLEWVAISFSNA